MNTIKSFLLKLQKNAARHGILFLLLSVSAHAIQIKTRHRIYFTSDDPGYACYKMMLTPHPSDYKLCLPYRHAECILFLADDFGGDTSLAPKIASMYSVAEIHQSDIRPPQNTHPTSRIHQWIADNTQPFPFPKDFFDIIVMRAGLCCCYADVQDTCGGIPNDGPSKLAFLERVITVLKKTPTSIAFLHGEHFLNGHYEENMQHWKDAIDSLDRTIPSAHVRMLFGPYEDATIDAAAASSCTPMSFFGIEIKWNGTPSQ